MLSDPKIQPRGFSHLEPDAISPARPEAPRGAGNATPVAPCPQCGFQMMAVRGSRDAVCQNCGFKDSCCY
jgi:DNA-directed RNA polymerase subunit RPC12/RpoP